MLYQYWLVRYVPDVARIDSASAGVITVGRDRGDAAFRFVESSLQLPAIGHSRTDFMRIARLFEQNLRFFIENEGFSLGNSRDLRSFIERERRQNHGIFQIDSPGQIASINAAEAADALFDRLVFRQESVQRQQRVTVLKQQTKNVYEGYDFLRKNMVQNPILEVPHADERMDLAIVAQEVFEISSAFSFQGKASKGLRDRVRSWTYSMEKLRKSGGELLVDKRARHGSKVNKEVSIAAIVDLPINQRQQKIFYDSTSDWKDLGIKLVSPHSIQSHAEKLNNSALAS